MHHPPNFPPPPASPCEAARGQWQRGDAGATPLPMMTSSHRISPSRGRNTALFLVLGALLLAAFPARAQWKTESYELKQGWNAVWIPLDLSHASIEDLAPATIVEVWRWNALEAGTFTEVPSGAPSQTQSQWSVWRRNDPAGSNLSQFTGNFAYLIRVEPNTTAFTWRVTGRPEVPRYDWSRTGVNLVGFPVQAPANSSNRSIAQFFVFDPVLKTLPPTLFYNGGELSDVAPRNPLRIGNMNSFAAERFQAYWVQATSYTEYYGPVKVDVGNAGGLRFGSEGLSVSVRMKNVVDLGRNQTVTMTLAPRASEAAPSGQPAHTGAVPLLVRGALNLVTGQFAYNAFNAPITRTLAPGAEEELIFTVDRSQLGNQAGLSYASLLEITDSLNLTSIVLPVSAETTSRSGLWVGAAVMDKVDYQRGQTVSAGEAAPSLFTMRLLLHSDGAGVARLLQQAYTGTATGGVAAVGAKQSSFTAPGKPNGRLSSAHFPVGMSLQGAGAVGLSGSLTFTLPLDYRDPSNPFVHAYHPDHDNLDDRFQGVLPKHRESPEVNRTITLNFAAQNPVGFDPSWGSTTLGGTYTETVTGLRATPITTSGHFILRRKDATPNFLP
jgi:hypothetical protein